MYDVLGSHGDTKVDASNARAGEATTLGSGCSSYSSLDNGVVFILGNSY